MGINQRAKFENFDPSVLSSACYNGWHDGCKRKKILKRSLDICRCVCHV